MNGDNRRRVDRKDTRISKKQKLILSAEEKLETKLGFDLFTEGEKRLGWLLTFATVSSYSFVSPKPVTKLKHGWNSLTRFHFSVVVMGGPRYSESV